MEHGTTPPVATARLDSEDLTVLADRARDALGCRAVLITGRDSGGRTTIVGMSGLTPDDVQRDWPAFLRADRADDDWLPPHPGMPHVHSLPAVPLNEGEQIRRLALFVSGKRMGGLHLVCATGTPHAETLAADFGGHAAMAMASRRLRRGSGMQVERRIAQSEAILDLAAAISWVGFENLVGRVAAAVRNVIGLVRVRVYLFNEDSGLLEPLPEPDGTFPPGAEPVDPHDMRHRVARVFATGRADLTNAPASSLLTTPMFVSGRATGVLEIVDKPRGFTMTDLHDAQLLARPIAVSVELTANVRRLRVRSEIEAVLSDAAADMRDGDDFAAQLPGVLAAMRKAIDADLVAYTPESALRQNAWRDDLDETSRRRVCALAEHPGTPRGVLVTPVTIGDQRVGTLVAVWLSAGTVGRPERRGFARLAHVIALSIASAAFLRQRTALARLEERHRFAGQLHDEVAQFMFAAQIQLDEVLELDEIPDEAVDRLGLASSLLARGDATLRRVISELPQQSSQLLANRIEAVLEEVRRAFRADIRSTVRTDAVDSVATAETQDLLVAATRELVVNAAKHAGPCTIEVLLDAPEPGLIRLQVTDDGVGLDARAHRDFGSSGHGLPSLRRNVAEAGGTLDLFMSASSGTTVALTLGAASFP
ncbi:GAF domain-containing sensor histidine kinase [Herbidospora mongoliensis]|uniref:GAF domain-containing sensor histidine kinase n=1 Tax=Herbidospora mongoliensis TaxID=688067 RepID=UPI00082952DE|nr:GAF domain-containing protein [Herbidospora mongoliensis]